MAESHPPVEEGPMSGIAALAALAFGEFKKMVEVYDQKYGKYGEQAVRRLKLTLAQAKVWADHLEEELAETRADLAQAQHAAELYRRLYNEGQAQLAARDAGVRPVDPDPYADGDPT